MPNYQQLSKESINFVRYVSHRMNQDRVNVTAGYLAYITLISLVPMLTVLVSILSSFTVFKDVSDVIQDFVITHFVPTAGDAVSGALSQFVANTGQMTIVGSIFLFVAAITLISNVDRSLNFIWRVRNKRRVVFSLSMYWMFLTLGPLLIGTSIALSSYITSLKVIDNETLTGVYNLFLRWLPVLLSFLAFTVLYLLVPNKKVKLHHAFIGAVAAAVLFEFSKKGFAFYITNFPSYQLIYGALAAIPILFVWVYLCWLIVLFGAEVTAALGEEVQWRTRYQEAIEKMTQAEDSNSDSVNTKSE